jgi:hypothetical protein
MMERMDEDLRKARGTREKSLRARVPGITLASKKGTLQVLFQRSSDLVHNLQFHHFLAIALARTLIKRPELRVKEKGQRFC